MNDGPLRVWIRIRKSPAELAVLHRLPMTVREDSIDPPVTRNGNGVCSGCIAGYLRATDPTQAVCRPARSKILNP